ARGRARGTRDQRDPQPGHDDERDRHRLPVSHVSLLAHAHCARRSLYPVSVFGASRRSRCPCRRGPSCFTVRHLSVPAARISPRRSTAYATTRVLEVTYPELDPRQNRSSHLTPPVFI